jgi:hypothetical protein
MHMHEARWLGFDTNTKTHCVYWHDSGTVAIECNVYFGTAAPLKGEQNIIILMIHSEQPAAPHTPTPPPNTTPPMPAQDNVPEELPLHLHRSARLCKPSCLVRDLQSSEGTAAPSHTCGLQLPGSYKEEEEAGGAWTVEDSAPVLLEDFEGIEFVLAAETADAEAMEPHMLAEAKRRPNWPLWEKAIEEELSTLKAAGTWRLEEAPPGANIIGSKWVFKAKKDVASNIVHYKAQCYDHGLVDCDLCIPLLPL